MPGRLASPRFRRRVLRLALVATAVGAASVVVVFFRNTSTIVESPLRGGGDVYVAPQSVELTEEERRVVLATAARFLQTAVRRDHPERAYELAGPGLRGGTSSEDWRRGDIPVVPYPVDEARWEVDYAYADEIGLQVAVFPDTGATLRPLVFDMSLRRSPGSGGRWLVEAWSPHGGGGGGSRPSRGDGSPLGLDLAAPPSASARLDVVWLLAPAALVALVLLVPAGVAVAGRVRARRAERAYQNSSSSPS